MHELAHAWWHDRRHPLKDEMIEATVRLSEEHDPRYGDTARLAYGYVHFEPGAGGIVTSFNSAGAVNTVTPGPTGVWTVRLPALGPATPAGDVQVNVELDLPVGVRVARPQEIVVRIFVAPIEGSKVVDVAPTVQNVGEVVRSWVANPATVRLTRGRDIAAACGQLAVSAT